MFWDEHILLPSYYIFLKGVLKTSLIFHKQNFLSMLVYMYKVIFGVHLMLHYEGYYFFCFNIFIFIIQIISLVINRNNFLI